MPNFAAISLILTVALGYGGAGVERGVSLSTPDPAGRPMAQWRLPGAGPLPAAGKLLVARSGMRDPNFAETVVLLIAYDKAGALGLIVNRRSEVGLSEVLPDVELLKDRGDSVYLGGPVNRNRMFLLVRAKERPELARPVVDDVYVSESPELLENLLEQGSAAEFRAFAGYAGWGAGQLDAELEAGGWRVVAGSGDRVFTEQPGSLWRRLQPLNKMQWSRLIPRAE